MANSRGMVGCGDNAEDLAKFMRVTDTSEDTAKHYLKVGGGSVARAVDAYYENVPEDSGGAAANRGGGSSAPAGSAVSNRLMAPPRREGPARGDGIGAIAAASAARSPTRAPSSARGSINSLQQRMHALSSATSNATTARGPASAVTPTNLNDGFGREGGARSSDNDKKLAQFREFTGASLEEAKRFLEDNSYPISKAADMYFDTDKTGSKGKREEDVGGPANPIALGHSEERRPGIMASSHLRGASQVPHMPQCAGEESYGDGERLRRCQGSTPPGKTYCTDHQDQDFSVGVAASSRSRGGIFTPGNTQGKRKASEMTNDERKKEARASAAEKRQGAWDRRHPVRRPVAPDVKGVNDFQPSSSDKTKEAVKIVKKREQEDIARNGGFNQYAPHIMSTQSFSSLRRKID